MEPVILTNPDLYPDKEVLSSVLGTKFPVWVAMLEQIHSVDPSVTEHWKFYNDGKCWLFRTMKKQKTIFWAGVTAGGFRISFYLSDKAELLIEASQLPLKIRQEFSEATRSTSGRSLTLEMNDIRDVGPAITLAEIKIKLK